ncbi:DNA-3-methyladenine glycosylase 2 family protein [Allokutzneria albata]|uniref:DNA-3-methyladenine glycosylase 2 family protein n=1 Tax=Allokutzneria albata TaxID=211114 RepID=UPI0009DE0070|nr:AlkA N-terminal domain-containing protein [Allokutzneria albata]
MLVDSERAYRAVASRDARFDGCFVLAVRTTGIYCRPSCPAMTPKRRNVEFFPTTAAAQSSGYRACRRCLPDAVPGSPEWDLRADLASRAMRLIGDGVVEREGVPGLARRLGYSERHLSRVLTAELGAGPLALARAHRAHAARTLIETTALPFADIAFAAGFSSVRQFNETMQAVFAASPSVLRAGAQKRRRSDAPAEPRTGTITLRLPFRPPMDADGLLAFLAARAIPGVEHVEAGVYSRAIALPHGSATVRLEPAPTHVHCRLHLVDLRDLGAAVSRVRRLLDLDADPLAVDEVLSADASLRPLVAATPGIRVPGTMDAHEMLVRALLGQQVSVASARTAVAALTRVLGTPLPSTQLPTAEDQLTTLFPTAEAIAARGAEVLTGPRKRVETVLAACAALADGSLQLHIGRDDSELVAELQELPGIGRWTADYLAMRVLGTPDVLLATDTAMRKGAGALGLPSDVDGLRTRARSWRPWRSYAGMHLWHAAAPAASPSTTRRTA